jgi:hypothetical protein
MNDQQRQSINRAAQEFTDALVAAYRTASDNTAVAQQLGAQQIEYFFDAVIGNLRAQAGGTSQMARQLASQQRLAQEATRDLARLSTDNYMDLLDSVFAFYQGGASRTQRRAEEARGHIEEAEDAGRAGRGTGRGGQGASRAGRGTGRGGQGRISGNGAEPRGGPEARPGSREPRRGGREGQQRSRESGRRRRGRH